MRKVWAIAGGSTLVYIVLALMMAIIPGIELSKTPPGPGVKPLTALQSEGRAVYAANGCGYCHTQQVRPLAEDKPFGRPSAPGDFTYQTPELLGSERTGPDLTDVGVQQGSDVWQYMHLYNPRSVVPQSIMPSLLLAVSRGTEGARRRCRGACSGGLRTGSWCRHPHAAGAGARGLPPVVEAGADRRRRGGGKRRRHAGLGAPAGRRDGEYVEPIVRGRRVAIQRQLRVLSSGKRRGLAGSISAVEGQCRGQ